MEVPLEHLHLQQLAVPLETGPRAGAELLSRVDQCVPAVAVEAREQEALDGAAARVAPAEQPRRNDPRVVYHQQITRRQQLGQFREPVVRSGAGVPVDPQQA